MILPTCNVFNDIVLGIDVEGILRTNGNSKLLDKLRSSQIGQMRLTPSLTVRWKSCD